MNKPPPDMKVRLSADLRRQIADAAQVNNRTLNGEIVSRLDASFRDDVATESEWLEKAQASSRIQMEKRLLKLEADTALLQERLAALESK